MTRAQGKHREFSLNQSVATLKLITLPSHTLRMVITALEFYGRKYSIL